MSKFVEQIRKMNSMYELPIEEVPKLEGVERLERFKSILEEECEEITDVIANIECSSTGDTNEDHLNDLTALADLLADIVVFCRSEAMRNGIPLEEVLDIVMESNFSKLGEDGKPIKDERGKFLKGPNYWKPEPRIKQLLKDRINGTPHPTIHNY